MPSEATRTSFPSRAPWPGNKPLAAIGTWSEPSATQNGQPWQQGRTHDRGPSLPVRAGTNCSPARVAMAHWEAGPADVWAGGRRGERWGAQAGWTGLRWETPLGHRDRGDHGMEFGAPRLGGLPPFAVRSSARPPRPVPRALTKGANDQTRGGAAERNRGTASAAREVGQGLKDTAGLVCSSNLSFCG